MDPQIVLGTINNIKNNKRLSLTKERREGNVYSKSTIVKSYYIYLFILDPLTVYLFNTCKNQNEAARHKIKYNILK